MVMLLDRSFLGEELLLVFKVFLMLLQFLKMLTEMRPLTALKKNGMEIATFLLTATGQCSSRLLDKCWTLFNGTGKPLRNAQRLLDSLKAVLKGYRKAAGKCPSTRHQPIGEKTELLSSYRHKQSNFS